MIAKAIAALVIALTSFSMAFGQDAKAEPTPAPETGVTIANTRVTISAKGYDVREVLYSLFEQTKRSFVLDPEVRYILYLSLNDVEFDEALEIVCAQAQVEFTVQNEIYFLNKKSDPAKSPTNSSEVSVHKLGKIADSDLLKRVTTRFKMADIRSVFSDLSKQTGISIEVSPKVPNYKLDAYLIDTSLKYALDVVTRAANLSYTRTDNKSIRIDVVAKG